MKGIKRVLALVLAGAIGCVFTACGGREEGKEYLSESKAFSIQAAGEWEVTPTDNPDHLVLDNADKTLTILIQRFPKEEAEKEVGITSLEDFMTFYKETPSIANIYAMAGEVQTEPLNIAGMTAGQGEELAAGGSKAYIGYLESKSSYYTATLTGLEELYDQNIQQMKTDLQTLQEQ